MARIRTIKPEFPHSESMGAVSRDARLLFILLWTLADDEGRLRGNSRMLASLLYPYDDDAPKQIEKWLNELDAQDCIVRYQIDGATYLEIRNWLMHQKIDKPSKSKIPPFEDESRILANPLEMSSEDQGPRIKDQGMDQGSRIKERKGLDGFDDFWRVYDKKVERPAAEKSWRRIDMTPDLLIKILQAAKVYVKSTPDKTYRKNPSTWLNNQCWNDEVVVKQPQQAQLSPYQASVRAAGIAIFGNLEEPQHEQHSTIDITPGTQAPAGLLGSEDL
jgi:hypothetical protein